MPGQMLLLTAILLGWSNTKAYSSPNQYKVYKETEREPQGSITRLSATNSEDTVAFNFHNDASGSNWVVNLRLSDGHESQANGPDEREPKGSHNIYWGSFGTNGAYNPNIGFYLHNSVSGSNWVKSSRYVTITLPYALRDVDSGVTYEVEADGRHVSATDKYGALLWYRDPFADSHLTHYRTDTPRIVSFDFHKRGESENWNLPERVFHNNEVRKFISISFNSTQYGFMDITNGDFILTGQR